MEPEIKIEEHRQHYELIIESALNNFTIESIRTETQKWFDEKN